MACVYIVLQTRTRLNVDLSELLCHPARLNPSLLFPNPPGFDLLLSSR